MKASEAIAKINKHYSVEVAKIDSEAEPIDRHPSGIFAFDCATGGGFGLGLANIVYGPESSGKTTLCLKTIATNQKLNPDKVSIFVDIEGHYNSKWAETLGVDLSRLIVVYPDYAEQAVDIIDEFLDAEDVGVIVLDSLAALITSNEVTSSAEKAVVGGSGLVVGKLYRKVGRKLKKIANEPGREAPTVLFINQIRFKVGVMFGDPETQPGGMAWKFGSCLTVRLYGKDIVEGKGNDQSVVGKTITGIVKKEKLGGVPNRTFTFDLSLVTSKSKKTKLGMVDDWKAFETHMRAQDLLGKNPDGAGWVMYSFDGDGTFLELPTLQACRDYFSDNLGWALKAKRQLIMRLVADVEEDE